MKANVPEGALLRPYADRADCFTDAYCADVGRPMALDAYLRAFYATWAFAPEKLLLRLALRRPAQVFEVGPLALGEADCFAAWDVEARTKDEVLLVDLGGRTRSWFKVDGSTVYFGSAVVPPTPGADLGLLFKSLLGFHKVYSRVLLGATVRKLKGVVG